MTTTYANSIDCVDETILNQFGCLGNDTISYNVMHTYLFILLLWSGFHLVGKFPTPSQRKRETSLVPHVFNVQCGSGLGTRLERKLVAKKKGKER